ncbi:Uncharacterised protein [Escherichia coli]|nr:Uncharacterised protein [Escherichia coli]
MREAVGAEALHAAAFVVHADQQVGAHGLDRGGEFQQLRAVLPVAREQDHAARERVRQPAAIGRGERRAGDVEDDGGMFGIGGHAARSRHAGC